MSDRDDQILAHIGLYQLSLRCVLESQFFEGGNCGNVMQRLVTDQKVQRRDGLPGRLVYYQLTRAEAKRRELPESRARALQNQALHSALAVLWFCSFGDRPRHRLEVSEVTQVLSDQLPTAIHCIERGSEQHRILRMKVVDPESDDRTLLRSLRRTIHQTIEVPGLRPWIQTGRYAFAVLTETAARVERIRKVIQSDETLSSLATFVVEQAPGVRTLSQAIHDRLPEKTQQQLQFPSPETTTLPGDAGN